MFLLTEAGPILCFESLQLSIAQESMELQKESVIEKGHNQFEYHVFKKINAKLIRMIKMHCYDNDIGWSIVKSSTICFAAMLFSFQLKSLMKNFH